MNRQHMPLYFLIGWYAFLLAFVLFFAIVLTIPPVDARPIQMPEYWTEYQDYLGNTYRYTNANLSQHPEYLKTENSTHYILNRIDDTLSIKKSLVYNGSFNFGISDISFTIIAPAFKIQNISTTNGTGQRRFPIDESLKTTFKRFTWDNKLPFVQIINNTGYNQTVPQSDYWYSRQSGKLYFNFKTANVTGLSADKNASFKFSSWTIDNSTTSGYTSNNVTTDGFWSAYGGGSIGTPLNQTIFNNLSGYWDMESTSGTIEYGINNKSRFPNSSIQGTFYGNTTLNYTAGQSWGNAVLLDGVNDYVSIPDSDLYPAGNNIQNFSVKIKFKLNNIVQDVWYTSALISQDFYGGVIAKWIFSLDAPNDKLRFEYYNGVDVDFSSSVFGAENNTWYDSEIKSQNNISGNLYTFYKNNQNLGNSFQTVLISNIITSPLTFGYGEGVGGFKGALKDVIITQSDNNTYSNSYATSFNLTINNQTASAGKIISAVRFNVPYLNSLNNTANISVRQNGTSTWTQVSTDYQNYTWVNFTGYPNTDIRFEGYGNGSARMFILSGEIDEIFPSTSITISNLQAFTGNFWINHTWSGSNVSSYNVSINGTWNNGSTATFRNNTYSPHAWQNISVCGYNSTYDITGACSDQNTQIPNNPLIIPILHDYSVITGSLLAFTINGTDLDGDVPVYSTNATIGTFNATTGNFSYLGADIDKGNYMFFFSGSDGYGSITTQIIKITVISVLDTLLNEIALLPTKDDVNNAGIIGFMGGVLGGAMVMGVLKRRRY